MANPWPCIFGMLCVLLREGVFGLVAVVLQGMLQIQAVDGSHDPLRDLSGQYGAQDHGAHGNDHHGKQQIQQQRGGALLRTGDAKHRTVG